MRLILCLSVLLLSACAGQPQVAVHDDTSHPCPVFEHSMGDVEARLSGT